jgi:2'-5' RNA ligase
LEIYETFWSEAVSAFERGNQQVDPHLSDKTNDLRRGVTVVLRPSPSVRGNVKDFLDRLAAVCPEQYFYHPGELHVTVLSIISVTESWRKEIRPLASYRAIIGDVLSRQHSFKICFHGVTASPNAVMIQGFPMGDGLAHIRNELREAFARNGFGTTLDRRYKISTAHITAMRFRRPEENWKRLMSLLEENRWTDFGETEVNRLQLIWGDWYASGNIVRTLQEYRLSDLADYAGKVMFIQST